MNKKDLISVIVPCYNEEESLPLFYIETGKVLRQMTEVDYELIFVDDGSSDNTRAIMKNLAEKD